MSHGPPTEPPHRAGVTISQPAPFRTGLCSVTLRRLAVPEVLAAAAAAGLECIEWGGDIHVPPGDSALARQVGAATADAGLQVASYGSYFRAGPETLTDFEP